MIRLLAPAKINLTLEVLSRRPDGYHEIGSVLQTIGLYDELTFEAARDITFRSEGLDLASEENLVLRAARLLQRESGRSPGAAITLKKIIPAGAGLGGGSSDAAATLTALNQLWRLGLSPERLAGLAAELGSDVPFFIYGGAALAQGKGERVTPLGTVAPAWVVLLHPPIPVPAEKTRKMYQSLSEGDFTDGRYTTRMVERLEKEKRIDQGLLFNVFERIALKIFPELKTYWTVMWDAGNRRVNLAGSGPVLYAVFQKETDAVQLYDKLLPREENVYLAKTLN